MVKDLFNTIKYKRINAKLTKQNEELRKNNELLTELVEALKVRCVYLEKREDKLVRIEQMVANKEDFRKIRTFIKGE